MIGSFNVGSQRYIEVSFLSVSPCIVKNYLILIFVNFNQIFS